METFVTSTDLPQPSANGHTEAPNQISKYSPSEPSVTASSLAACYTAVRCFSEKLCEPLVPEDYVIQSMPDVSPTKWHLAHTSWFFETFLLLPHLEGYRALDPAYAFLFNSY